jgi:hypothetical protein
MARFKSVPSLKLCVSLSIAPVVLILAVGSASAAGEDATLQQSLAPGMRIRIQAPEVFPGKIIGTIHSLNDESVTIDVPGRSEPVAVLREKIARLDESDGPRSRGVDAAIGAGVGAAIGAAGGALAGRNQSGHIVSGGAVTAFCALLGTGVGALIGVAIPPGEHWKQIPTGRYRVSFAPGLAHGLDLAIAWNF